MLICTGLTNLRSPYIAYKGLRQICCWLFSLRSKLTFGLSTMLMEATKMYSSIDPPQPQAGPSSKPIRRCPQALCGHAIFPPNWKYGICPTCLEQFRNPTKAQQDEARSNASRAERDFRANNATASTSRSADNNGYMSRPALVVVSLPLFSHVLRVLLSHLL